MKKQDKQKYREKPIKELEEILSDLRFQLIKAEGSRKKQGKGTNTQIIKNTKKNIAIIKTFINQKKQIKDSIERCKDKPSSKRRDRRLKGKMKELKVL